MTPRLSLRGEAAEDIRTAARWYEDQRPGLASEYLRTVRALLASIEREPLRYPVARDEVRRALLRRFPYAVYFVVRAEETIVIACLHIRRDPALWQSRG